MEDLDWLNLICKSMLDETYIEVLLEVEPHLREEWAKEFVKFELSHITDQEYKLNGILHQKDDRGLSHLISCYMYFFANDDRAYAVLKSASVHIEWPFFLQKNVIFYDLLVDGCLCLWSNQIMLSQSEEEWTKHWENVPPCLRHLLNDHLPPGVRYGSAWRLPPRDPLAPPEIWIYDTSSDTLEE